MQAASKNKNSLPKKYLEIFLLFAQVSSLLRACLRADEQITLRNKLELDISSNEEDIGANYWKECKWTRSPRDENFADELENHLKEARYVLAESERKFEDISRKYECHWCKKQEMGIILM